MPAHRSAYAYAVHGPLSHWTDDTHLAAGLLDTERAALWQRAGSRGPKPKPIRRPKDRAIKRLATADLKKERMQTGVIGTALAHDDMRAWLQRVNGI